MNYQKVNYMFGGILEQSFGLSNGGGGELHFDCGPANMLIAPLNSDLN